MPAFPTTAFSPRRGLLHPLWLGALGVLALNDHVLKGSGLLPGVVTGKLSDFAGLLVAPLLFAVLLHVRGRVGWLFAHVAVGVVFSGIQLSRPFADLWSDAMGLVGFPWVITSDPTDLLALPMLAVSWIVYGRATSVRANLRRTAEYGAAVGGLFACVATSAEPEPIPWTIEADVYFHNDNDFDAVVRLRQLAPAAQIDCEVVAEDPGRYLTEPMFGPIESWTVWPDANLPLAPDFRGAVPCHAVWLEADSVAPVIVFWRGGDPVFTTLDGEGIDPEAPGFVSLSYDDEGRGTYDTEMDILFAAVPPSGRVEGTCAPQGEADRIVWSDEIPSGFWFLGAVEEGVDGCVAMDLRTGFEQQESFSGQSWYLCLPPGAFPFEAGTRVEIFGEYSAGALAGEVDGLVMRELEAETNATTGRELVVSRGSGVASLFGMTATFAPMFECTPQVEPECGAVVRPGTLTLAGGGFNTLSLGLGHAATTGIEGTRLDVFVSHAEQRFTLVAECSEGPDVLGTDIELVAVKE